MELEDELRRALRPVDPPGGFEERVLARVVSGGPVTDAVHGGDASHGTEGRSVAGHDADPALDMLPRRRRWISGIAAAAAVLVMATAGGMYYEHRLERAEAMRATNELRQALSIASQKLAIVQERVRRPEASEF